MPGNYEPGVFEECQGDDAYVFSLLPFFFDSHSGESFRLPMGVYGTSTFHQGTPPTPVAHPAPSASNCRTIPSITAGPVRAKRSLEKKFAPAFPKQTSPP